MNTAHRTLATALLVIVLGCSPDNRGPTGPDIPSDMAQVSPDLTKAPLVWKGVCGTAVQCVAKCPSEPLEKSVECRQKCQESLGEGMTVPKQNYQATWACIFRYCNTDIPEVHRECYDSNAKKDAECLPCINGRAAEPCKEALDACNAT